MIFWLVRRLLERIRGLRTRWWQLNGGLETRTSVLWLRHPYLYLLPLWLCGLLRSSCTLILELRRNSVSLMVPSTSECVLTASKTSSLRLLPISLSMQ